MFVMSIVLVMVYTYVLYSIMKRVYVNGAQNTRRGHKQRDSLYIHKLHYNVSIV